MIGNTNGAVAPKLHKKDYIKKIRFAEYLCKKATEYQQLHELMDEQIIFFNEPVSVLLSEKTRKYRRHFKGDEIFGPHEVIKTDATYLTLGDILSIVTFGDRWVEGTEIFNIHEDYIDEQVSYMDCDLPIDCTLISSNHYRDDKIRHAFKIRIKLNNMLYKDFTYANDNFKNYNMYSLRHCKWLVFYLKPVVNYKVVELPKSNEFCTQPLAYKYLAGTNGLKIACKYLFEGDYNTNTYMVLVIKIEKIKLK